MRKMTFRLMAAGAVVVAATAAGLSAATAGHAPAHGHAGGRDSITGITGGGCQQASADGYSVSACISGQGQLVGNDTLIPDYYVTGVPDPSDPNCTVDWSLIDDSNGTTILSDFGSCLIGHQILPPEPATSGDSYSLRLQVEVSNPDGTGTHLIIDTSSPLEFD